jgi:phage baseplate assembly protein W|tara:strand:- start:165 stop:557 length:393 start_codon:yes stop_codon:yes gene_type:complete
MPSIPRTVDLDLNFTRNPITSDVSLLIQNNAVKRSLRNLVFFNFLEKPFNPLIDVGLRGLLFESNDPFFQLDIQEKLRDIIRNYEPRVDVKQIKFDENNFDRNAMNLTIYFSVSGQDNIDATTVTIKRVR